MAVDYFLCIMEEMDRLWFRQIILLPESKASVALKPSQTPPPLPESFSCPASVHSLPLLPDEVTFSSTDESPSPEMQASSESISVSLLDNSNNVEEKKERPTRINHLGSRVRSLSSTPTAQNRPRKSRKATSARRLQKSMSCRTMGELEIEEVKGFMDLGFIFKQDNISPRMMSLVPGLQRLGITITQTKQDPQVMDKQEEEEEERDIMRPYLSEAWLIKRPNSPLLNLRIPRLCSSAHMKKHLLFWARTVASEIHLHECRAMPPTYSK